MTSSAPGALLLNRQLRWRISRHARRLTLVALAGLALAVVTRRPEFVAVAAPSLVVLSTWRGSKPDAVQVGLRLSAARVFEGEQVAVEVTVAGSGDSALELVLHPSEGIEVVPGHDRGATTPLTLSLAVSRWGRYWPGFVEVVAWDRCRLFEAHAFAPLPELDCYPLPAVHRRAVVLGRWPAGRVIIRPVRRAKGGSSPACASTRPVTGSAASTGRRRRGEDACRSTRSPPSGLWTWC